MKLHVNYQNRWFKMSHGIFYSVLWGFFMDWMSFFLGQIGSIVPRDYEKSMFMHFIQTEIQQKF